MSVWGTSGGRSPCLQGVEMPGATCDLELLLMLPCPQQYSAWALDVSCPHMSCLWAC